MTNRNKIARKELITKLHREASRIDSLRLNAALRDTDAQKQLVEHFKNIQLSSGGFTATNGENNSYSFAKTFRVYQIMKELKTKKATHEIVKKITQFFKNSQNTGGFWSENTKKTVNEEQLEEKKLFFSAIATLVLVIEEPGSNECIKGLNYLEKNQQDDRTFKGDTRTNWFSATAILAYYGTYYYTGKEMILIIDEILDKTKDVSCIQSIASLLILAGYNKRSLGLLDRAIYLLEKMQGSNGLWTSNTNHDRINTSINCLVTLLQSDSLD